MAVLDRFLIFHHFDQAHQIIKRYFLASETLYQILTLRLQGFHGSSTAGKQCELSELRERERESMWGQALYQALVLV